MRIEQHPILEFQRGEEVTFSFEGRELTGYTNETIAGALHANGIKELMKSPELHRSRGLFCAIGNCSSCLMIVNGQPNVRACVVKVKQGMKVRAQSGKLEAGEVN